MNLCLFSVHRPTIDCCILQSNYNALIFVGQKPDEEYKCPIDVGNGNYADPVTCKRFYQCVDGYPYLNRCPSGLYFDDINKYCTFKDEARCGPIATSEYIFL